MATIENLSFKLNQLLNKEADKIGAKIIDGGIETENSVIIDRWIVFEKPINKHSGAQVQVIHENGKIKSGSMWLYDEFGEKTKTIKIWK